ncbi:hypothetical protein BV22DRAFT_1076641 [Leucogyrophana mollusca]|uniref:Uncharacterized protein n=1 Tax=Leucogyrophana mollusca TaxID=85980 RepID=A0ACB8AWJ2_9AGAM|nr:hypothetical protein BV22DRAFT_1076641 [Leucogyrophana mollusca]
MEEIRGAERGSYIWGRSVHNIRIERLWVDVTSGFGSKWKDFFQGLEAHDGLDANMDSHIWLLHHLFLSDINEDASQWASTWNYHILQRRGEPHRSPQEMFLQGMVEHGQRAVVVAVDEDIGDIAEYGVDWNDIDNHNVRNHHDTFNPQDDHLSNPFVSNQPDRLSHVDIPNARCPLSPEQVEVFDTHLQTLPYRGQPDMESRRLLWIEGLDMVTRMW